MALDVNGYNSTFTAFADFAAQSLEAGKSKAVARVNYAKTGSLDSRTITAAKGDWVGIGVGRLGGLKDANNVARSLFRNAVIDMFGGEDKIPQSVKDAMKLADYGKGKPLTARRILAVKDAIDASGITKQKAALESISKFSDPATLSKAALEKGYTKGELPRLAAAANLYAEAVGCSEAEALEEVTTPNSKANRLMNYGGRFMQSAENFKEGLRLMDSFKEWFTQVRERKNADGEPVSLTDLNIAGTVTTRDSTAALERFVFEDLAVNGSLNLKETDPEKIFGVKDNAAMRFFAGNRGLNFTGVLANMPPEKRGVVYQVFDNLHLPLAETKEEALAREKMSSAKLGVRNPHLVIGRILRHLPEIEKLAANNNLTEANIVKTLFPDMQPRTWTREGMNQFSHDITTLAQDILIAKGMDDADAEAAGMSILLTMEETCCTLQEGMESFETGKRIDPPQYMTTATFSIEKLDGTTKAARDLLDGGDKNGDLYRPYNYAQADDHKNPSKFFIKNPDNLAFGFTFPDGTSLKTGAGKYAGNIPTVLDKIESLAGKVHPRQQSAVMFAVSQAGIGCLKGGLKGYGINSSEHAAVDFSLSKDDATGDIMIRYSSPKELPFSFEWTATIKTDGSMSTTPLKFTDEKTLTKDKAVTTEFIKNARGVKGKPAEVKDKVANFITEAAKSDRDLLALLRMNNGLVTYGVALDAAGAIRSDAKILQKLKGLQDNISELRVATRSDKRMFEIGLKQLALLEGNALKPGAITRMFEIVGKEDLGPLRNFSSKSSPDDIFRMICRLHRAVSKACADAKVFSTFGEAGGVEAIALNSFVTGLIFARCDAKTLNGIRNAIYSPNGGQVRLMMDMLVDGDFPQGMSVDPKDRVTISGMAHTLGSTYRYDIAAVVNDALDIKAPLMPNGEERAGSVDTGSFTRVVNLFQDYMEDYNSLTASAANEP